MFAWPAFFVCTGIIVYSGIKLSKYGDIIADKTSLGGAWIGVVLMASVTSLPELVTGITSVAYANVPDIAVGDVIGSCVFNIFIIALLDILHRPAPISTKAHHSHVLSAGFGILLLGIIAVSLLMGRNAPDIGWIGFYSIITAIIYFIAMRLIFFYQKKQIASFVQEVAAAEEHYDGISLKKAAYHYTLNAFFVIVAALFLPSIGERIAVDTGLGQTFVGNAFIAISTSLPEVVVSIAAVKIGAIDLAIGNLFGSNIFNIFILAIDDIFYINGPLLAHATQNHIYSALSAIIMTAIAIIGLTYRAEKKPLVLAWDAMGIAAVYMINLVLLYVLR